MKTVGDLVENAEIAKNAFQSGDWSMVAACARIYWEQKKLMCGGGCEPERVTRLLKKLYDRQIIDAGWLAGAGGGGFLYLMTKKLDCKSIIENILLEDKEVGSEMSVHEVCIDSHPFHVEMLDAKQ